MVIARLYVHLSYEDIALILKVNDPDRDRHQQRIEGKSPAPFDPGELWNEFKELSVGINSEWNREELFARQHLDDKPVVEEHLMQIKAGMERAKKPVEEQKLDLDCSRYIEELPTAQIGELYGWARRQARVEPNWLV